MIFISLAMTITVLIVSILASISDVRSLRIPNLYSLIVIGAFPVAFLATPELFSNISSHLMAMGAVFFVTYLMFFFNAIGGGDAKFGTALALWLGLKNIVPFLFCMTMIGGILGIIAIAFKNRKIITDPRPGSWIEQIQSGRSAVPYGVAISIGFWVALFYGGFIHSIIQALR